MWRASKNLIPTAENLLKRKCLQDPICKRCCKSVETIYHALLECKTTKKIWTHAPLQPNFQNSSNQSILSIIQDMPSNMRKSDFELLISLCWVAWYAQNKFIFKGKKIDPMLSAAKAEAVIDAFQRARKPGATHIYNSSKVPQLKWKLPPKNVFKVNVDAAINSKSQVAGLGAVIRDSENKIVAAGIKQTGMKEHVSYAEAEAIE
ncbi:putative reverse transcriptase [Citrus sinensis]|uniref:Reverse transcriptase n=1 Tax=Citrus sinensis TaxID=2711 RepID=A0ACB8N456_CITSI|nr:putative reverse transcriptase [Citrus sinensis]